MFLVLSGKMGAGKDTTIDDLKTRWTNKKFVKVGFGDYLKEICINLFRLKREVCYGPDKNIPTVYRWKDMPFYKWYKHFFKRNNLVTHREFLQEFGTGICRKIYSNCWVDYVLNMKQEPGTIYLINDCRFPNELLALIESKNAVIIRLLRNPVNNKHSSETALDDFHWKDFELVDNRHLGIKETTDKVIENFNIQCKLKGLN